MPAQQQNRKDILQAYRLMTDRMALALIAGEPDSPNQPLRRRTGANFAGIALGVLVAAGFAVWGLIAPGSAQQLTSPGTLTIDKDTGTAYVPCQKTDLCPALNYPSALLALQNTSPPSPRRVAQASLSQYTIGPTIGIPGLPQDLPTEANLVHDPWSVCSVNGVSTLVGGQSVGGTPVSASPAQPHAVLVTAPEAGYPAYWLLWNGVRLRIYLRARTVLYGQVAAVPVSPALLNAIPQGPDLVAHTPPGEGTPVASGPTGEPSHVGQAYETTLGRFFVLEEGGKLASVSQAQAQLLDLEKGMASGTGSQIAPPIPESAVQTASGGSTDNPQLPSILPTAVPATSSTPVCVTYTSRQLDRQLTTGGTVPTNPAPTPASTSGNGMVGRVWLPPGHGAIIGATTDVTQAKPLQWFLLEGATRYGMTSSQVPAWLGYKPADETVLPASVAALIPEGSAALDPDKAIQRASG